jgi:hypothetical protein
MIRPVAALAVAALALVGCSPPHTTTTTTPGATMATTAAPTPAPAPKGNPEDQYLAALRAAHVSVSTTGQAELQIGHGVCQQVANGASPEALARDLVKIGVGWTATDAETIVNLAQKILCD